MSPPNPTHGSAPPRSRNRGGAAALAASSLFTCASFAASLLAIVLVVRDISIEDRAGLFLFLALYGPITTIMAQRYLLSIYQSRARRKVDGVIELVLVATLTVAAVWFAVSPYFHWFEIAGLITVIFSQTFASKTAGAIQHRSRNSLLWAGLVFSAGLGRILTTWALLGYGPVLAFVAGAYVYALGLITINAIFSRGLAAEQERAESGPSRTEGWRDRIAEISFFVAGALLFQADKYALNAEGRLVDLAQSGAMTTLLLSPLSILFATLYRSKTHALFSPETTWRDKLPLQLKIAAAFVAGAAAYVLILQSAWLHPAKFLFPFLTQPAGAYLALAAAIICDRLISLATFSSQDWRFYVLSAAMRVGTFALAYLAIRSAMSENLLADLYLLYAGGAAISLIIVFWLIWMFQSHVRR